MESNKLKLNGTAVFLTLFFSSYCEIISNNNSTNWTKCVGPTYCAAVRLELHNHKANPDLRPFKQFYSTLFVFELRAPTGLTDGRAAYCGLLGQPKLKVD